MRSANPGQMTGPKSLMFHIWGETGGPGIEPGHSLLFWLLLGMLASSHECFKMLRRRCFMFYLFLKTRKLGTTWFSSTVV